MKKSMVIAAAVLLGLGASAQDSKVEKTTTEVKENVEAVKGEAVEAIDEVEMNLEQEADEIKEPKKETIEKEEVIKREDPIRKEGVSGEDLEDDDDDQ